MKDKNEIIKEAIENGVTLTDFIDYIIRVNGVIGVGLISLADGIKDYLLKEIK